MKILIKTKPTTCAQSVVCHRACLWHENWRVRLYRIERAWLQKNLPPWYKKKPNVAVPILRAISKSQQQWHIHFAIYYRFMHNMTQESSSGPSQWHIRACLRWLQIKKGGIVWFGATTKSGPLDPSKTFPQTSFAIATSNVCADKGNFLSISFRLSDRSITGKFMPRPFSTERPAMGSSNHTFGVPGLWGTM